MTKGQKAGTIAAVGGGVALASGVMLAGYLGMQNMKVGASPTESAWTWLYTLLGGGGTITIGGVIALIVTWWNKLHGAVNPLIPSIVPGDPNPKQQLVPELIELGVSFTGFLQNKSSKPAQRRFMFAMVDAASQIPGLQTSTEGGIIVLKYSGFADVTPLLASGSIGSTGFNKVGE